ncbi:MAG: recombination protein RecR [Saprospiraceae bacterium]|nr:recombination protein RecR [Saprospiraceae bacterium]
MKFSSKLVEEAVEAMSSLPSIGKKTALRLIIHLIQSDSEKSERIATALTMLKSGIKECANCHNISDNEICEICSDPRRNANQICVVETIRDIMAIEATEHYQGHYHVLGGVINPIEGIGIEHLKIKSLIDRVNQIQNPELIMALSPTIEGDTTVYFISKQLQNPSIQISTIARGVSFGGELEYADELTLGRSIISRVPYHTQKY